MAYRLYTFFRILSIAAPFTITETLPDPEMPGKQKPPHDLHGTALRTTSASMSWEDQCHVPPEKPFRVLPSDMIPNTLSLLVSQTLHAILGDFRRKAEKTLEKYLDSLVGRICRKRETVLYICRDQTGLLGHAYLLAVHILSGTKRSIRTRWTGGKYITTLTERPPRVKQDGKGFSVLEHRRRPCAFGKSSFRWKTPPEREFG